MHYIVVGNPGAGKSTILNTLLGRPHFRAGVSIGNGLTECFRTVSQDGNKYSDTPGLNSLNTRKQAAEEIARTLTQNATIRLLFTVTLDAGRIRPDDVATISLVLDALENGGADVEGKFSLIVNKCQSGLREQLRTEENTRFLLREYGAGRKCEHLLLFPLEERAMGRNNVLLQGKPLLLGFIRSAPDLRLRGNRVNIEDERLEDTICRLEEELRKAYERLEELSGNDLPEKT